MNSDKHPTLSFEREEAERAIKIILQEYSAFMRELKVHHEKTLRVLYEIEASQEELQVGTSLAVKKFLNLDEGDQIHIKENGEYTVEKKEAKMANENDTPVTLNGREVTSEKLEEQKKFAESQSGTKLEEVKKGDFRLRLQD